MSERRRMQQHGTLTQWNDDRGFGFITPASGGDRVFVHISAFGGQRRPVVNDAVTYSTGWDEQGRVRAMEALLPGGTGQPKAAGTREAHRRSRPRGLGVALVVVAIFFAGLAALVASGLLHVAVPVASAVVSMGLYGLYGADKKAARDHRWRVPENTLQVLALLGGWPGALVAQRRFRHKTRKQPFQVVFWITVVLNCLFLAWLAAGMPTSFG